MLSRVASPKVMTSSHTHLFSVLNDWVILEGYTEQGPLPQRQLRRAIPVSELPME